MFAASFCTSILRAVRMVAQSKKSSTQLSRENSFSFTDQIRPRRYGARSTPAPLPLPARLGRSVGRSVADPLPFRRRSVPPQHLRQYCEKQVCKEVYVPQPNQSVDITSETNIYRVTLN